MLEVRQRSITPDIRSRLMLVPTSERVLPAASLLGRAFSAISTKRMRVGTATPGPKVKTSRTPSDGMNESRLVAASDTAERISDWSSSFDNRMQNSVLHWEMMVGSISAGRCVTSPRKTPYFRPSLAMRDSARRVGPKPIFLSAGA